HRPGAAHGRGRRVVRAKGVARGHQGLAPFDHRLRRSCHRHALQWRRAQGSRRLHGPEADPRSPGRHPGPDPRPLVLLSVIDGLVVVDKAAGWTSHDVVAKCRGIFGQKRVGHAGTLDPGATGVLLVGLGRVTRLLRYPGSRPKAYAGEVVLGVETSTLDDEGEVVATHEMAGVSLDDVRSVAAGFVGDIEQVPPMVSAVKIGGRRLHDLARRGVEVERDPRRVAVYSFDVDGTDAPGVLRIDITCSAGTYVRVLAADLGRALGGGAHLRRLRRTAVGEFLLDEARPVEALGQDA